ENTSGPLGQGHTMAVGAAVAERFLVARFGEWMAHKTYTFISDGGIQEEISQGAGRIAGHLGLSNLIMFYDSNDIQLSSETDVVTTEDTAKKYEAWGWNVMTINGNNPDEIRKALDAAQKETEKPTLIIGKTIMGKGCVTEDGGSFERQCSTHGQPLSGAGASIVKTIKNLGGDPENPFQISSDIQEFYSKRSEDLVKAVAQKKAEQAKWEAENPELAKKLRAFFSNEAAEFDYSKIEQKAGVATRGASGAVLAEFAKEVDNMIVASADLSNSDKTDGFLKNSKAFAKGDFTGKFLQAGVSELTMGAIMNGMALHGGVIPACGTFFVFSDYMKPVARLAALMELPVKYIWTHDAFRVGEDGPTHQPVEQEAQIRLLEKLQNHSHKNSMLVLRPADGNETTAAWKLAMENTDTPTALILSRQGIQDVTTFETAKQADKGAYIIKDVEGTPDVILLASGSEVSTLADGAELLEKDGIKCRIVSVPSEGLFRTQPAEYQEAILPKGVKKFGMTAGLPVTLEGLVGADGNVFGMPSFGFSASYKVLDEKLGFNGQNVYNQVKDMLA
ncbi:MAG TPA: transketolase C-terminal domain-containing protein, partial [Bacteroidales bacterium]|nr:transketolase C-terminal domain-containing protein [Bacteroidales bacterium]